MCGPKTQLLESFMLGMCSPTEEYIQGTLVTVQIFFVIVQFFLV